MSNGSAGDAPVKVTIVYHSGYGHTARIAEYVAKGARDVGAQVTVVKAEEADPAGEEFSGAHAIVFGSPTYMGNVSGPFKTFVDKTSKPWFTLAWKDKIAAGFSHSGSLSGDKSTTLETLRVLAGQHAMLWVGNDLMPVNDPVKGDLNRIGSFSGLMTQSANDQGPDEIPSGDLHTAEHFGGRIARVTARFNGANLTPTEANPDLNAQNPPPVAPPAASDASSGEEAVETAGEAVGIS